MEKARFLSVWIGVTVLLATCGQSAEPPPSFRRDIRPILAAKCFACHGPDEEQRAADLRLDLRDDALDFGAIVPGAPGDSELVRRIFSEDENERMPPRDSIEQLSPPQKQLLRDWVSSGAEYETHWAFVRPVTPPIPRVKNTKWPRNEIDRFVLAALEREELQPSPEADPHTLVRRLYLDLLGLPPTPEQADELVENEDPRAYEKLVERLLGSKHYGEHWARQWLDLARYSDTNGYEKDRPRSVWLYRDWVVRALNDDMPFDQFTIEQLAGDMLPTATPSQRIATGFHRNTMLNEEGGIDPLEYRFYAMVDRVATTGTVWLGLTIGCAQCHTHKYDPISHTEHYRLMALLNNADEPDLRVADASIAKRRHEVQDRIAALEAESANQFPRLSGASGLEAQPRRHLERQFAKWLKAEQARAIQWTTLRPRQLQSNLPKLQRLDDGSVFSSGDITKRDVYVLTFPLEVFSGPVTALRLEALPDARLPAGGPGRAYYEGRKGDFFLSEITATVDGRPVTFASASNSYGKISIGSGSADAMNVVDGDGSTGWSAAQREGEAHRLVLNLADPLAAAGELRVELLFERHFAASLGRFRFSATNSDQQVIASQIPVEVQLLLAGDAQSWTDPERDQVLRYYLSIAPELADARRRIDEQRKQLPAHPTTMVMQERPPDNPRKTFRHHRGEYLSPREEVAPGIPTVLSEPSENQPTNRLELATWLVSRRNPLVGRVTVNRAWRAFFGAGIVRTSGDFGTQSDPPTHPELLDWLACQFVEQGWSMKHLHRLIVSSATYRQGSQVTPELLKRDPTNRLLARGARYRVAAETVRDIMLQASGLLSSKMYGPGVRPPQPASVTALAYGNPQWTRSVGEDRYRRSLYTFRKRTAPFAAYAVFDSPSGESCTARRDRSNTPLQALTLLNDPMYLEMSRALAVEAMKRNPASVREAVASIFRRVLTRPPRTTELAELVGYQQSQQQRLDAGELESHAIGGGSDATSKLASLVMVARVMMNMDEAITRP